MKNKLREIDKKPALLPESKPYTFSRLAIWTIVLGASISLLINSIPAMIQDLQTSGSGTWQEVATDWTQNGSTLGALLAIHAAVLIAILLWAKPSHNHLETESEPLFNVSTVVLMASGVVLGIAFSAIISLCKNLPTTYPDLVIMLASSALIVALTSFIGSGVTLPVSANIRYNQKLAETFKDNLAKLREMQSNYNRFDPKTIRGNRPSTLHVRLRQFSLFSKPEHTLDLSNMRETKGHELGTDRKPFSFTRKKGRAIGTILTTLALFTYLVTSSILKDTGNYQRTVAVGVTVVSLYAISWHLSKSFMPKIARNALLAISFFIYFVVAIMSTGLIASLFQGRDDSFERICCLLILVISLVVTNFGISWFRMGAIKFHQRRIKRELDKVIDLLVQYNAIPPPPSDMSLE